MNIFKILKRGYERAKKLYKWNKLLWNDFDFDFVYLLEVMRLKLELMEPVIRNGYAVNSGKTANEIKKTRELLTLLIEDDFNKNWNDLEKQYGKFSIIDGHFERDRVTNENRSQYEFYTKLAFKLDEIEKKKVQNEFFKMFKKYENWWD